MLTQKIRAPRGRLSNAVIAGTNSWTNREKICLIEAVQSTGTDDWNEVSKFMMELTKGSRNKDWCSSLNCARQFQLVMESVGRQIRKKGDMEKDLLTSIRQHFVDERVKELQIISEDYRTKYMSLLKFHKEVEAGIHDDRVNEILSNAGTKSGVEETQEEGSRLFHFGELSDLSDKVSLIHSFIRNDIESTATSATPSPSKQSVSASLEFAIPTTSIMTTEEDEDLSDLMDILPTMETFDAEDLDASLMDTSEFEVGSPLDSSASTRKGPTSSPKVSPQLKNLVRTAIAGTSENERPRKATPSSGAPTLSMLLEMPPRDPGQPLPKISTVSKAAHDIISSPNDQQKLNDLVASSNPTSSTLEHLGIALSQSPTRHQEKQLPSTSSSPTLQRLLEGTVLIKKELGDSKPSDIFISKTPTIISEVEIKKEELEEFEISGSMTTSSVIVKTRMDNRQLLALSSSPSSVCVEKQSTEKNPEVFTTSPEVDSKPLHSSSENEIIHIVLQASIDNAVLGHVPQNSVTILEKRVLEETIDSTDIKSQEAETASLKDSSELPRVVVGSSEAMEVQSLPPDLQDKVSNLKDLVITQNIGVAAPTVSPSKLEAKTPSEDLAAGSNITTLKQMNPVTLTEETPAAISANTSEIDLDVKQCFEVHEDADTTVEESCETMPVLTPVPSLLPALLQRSDVIADGLSKVTAPVISTVVATSPSEVEAMEEENATEVTSEKHNIDKVSPAVDIPDIADSDDDITNRKAVLIPSKTYSRKERYGIEPPQIEEEDDSSNSGFETLITNVSETPLRVSPPRNLKSPIKTTAAASDKKGRKSRFSESKHIEVEGGTEEETRITRARSKPSSPLKAVTAPKLGTRTPEPTGDISAEQLPLSTRSTRSSRVSAVGAHPGSSDYASQSSALAKKSIIAADEREIQTASDSDIHPPGRTMRGRISSTSTSRVLESLPGITFESNPSSPSSSTTTSTNMEEDKEQRAFRKSVSILWDQIKSHKHAGQFLKPITDTMVPKYSRKIFRPMDLTTIKRHIDSGIIRSVQTFERDVYLMLMNATMYNSSDHEIHQRTLEMEHDVRTIIDNFKATQKALRASQTIETTGSETIRSPVKLRNRSRRGRKLSESDGDEVAMEESPSGEHTPASGTDNEIDDMECDRHAEQKTREGSPDIVSLKSGTGNKRRSRTSSPSSVHLAISSTTGKVAAERASSAEMRLRQTSPDVNSPPPLS